MTIMYTDVRNNENNGTGFDFFYLTQETVCAELTRMEKTLKF